MNRAKEVGHLGGERRPDSRGREPWPGGSRGQPGPRPPRHLEWLPAAGLLRGLMQRRAAAAWCQPAGDRGQVRACDMRATCLHSILHSDRGGKGQGGEGGAGQV